MIPRFVDEVVLELESGAGGPGHVSFRREKYVARGGPDGGDGGRGGDVVFVVRNNLKTLIHLQKKRRLHAAPGGRGGKRNRHGAAGRGLEVAVPPGTVIRDAETGAVLRDLGSAAEGWTFLRGGRGGHGNAYFKSSTHQAPQFAQPGEPGLAALVRVELNIIADIGLVGFPNAGKSSLLAALSNAQPEIADYPFTTKIPNLGVLTYRDHDVVLADIPGIIEGASQGAGLGLRFLKHISRTRGLAFLIDLTDPLFLSAFDVLLAELAAFAEGLADKPRILIGTKLDMPNTFEALALLAEGFPREEVRGVSAHSRAGLEAIKAEFLRMATV